MSSIKNNYSHLYSNYGSIGRQAEISGPGRNDIQNLFARVLEAQTSQNGSTSGGSSIDAQVDLDKYYSDIPSNQASLLTSVPLLMPNAQTIQSITDHASAQLQDMLEACNIPQAPERITYNNLGEMVLPDDYPHKEAFMAALDDNPGLKRELQDLNALSSHYAGIQQALANSSRSGYPDIALIVAPEGAISVQSDGETLFSPSVEADPAVMPPPESVVINGRRVIVSGHDLDEMEGRSLFRIVPGGNVQRLYEFAEQEMSAKERAYEDGILMIDGQPAMTVSTTRLTETQRYGYVNVEYFSADGQTGLDALKPGTEDEHYRRLVADYMDVVDAERELKETYGDDIKLIYSHVNGCHIMLTPDDARYDEMASAEEGVETLLNDIRKNHINRSAVEDLLAARGYTV